MNRRNFFRGAMASLFAFVGAKVLPAPKEPCWHVKAVRAGKIPMMKIRPGVVIQPEAFEYTFKYGDKWDGTNITCQAFKEVAESDMKVYRNTGKCDLNSLGKEETT